MIKTIIKILTKRLILGNPRKKTTEYWWELHEAAKKPGLLGHIKKQQYHKLVEKHNAFIPLQANFAGCPTLPHGISGIFISSGAQIGQNCTIFHQVTIGSNTLADSVGCGVPTIGNNVYIGCGAKIIGNVTIGDHVRIGANCVVTTDVPPNCTVVTNKPRIIPKENNVNIFTKFGDYCNNH